METGKDGQGTELFITGPSVLGIVINHLSKQNIMSLTVKLHLIHLLGTGKGALAEDKSWVPHTYIKWFTASCNSSSKGSSGLV